MYASAHQSWQHQIDAGRLLKSNKVYALYMDTGTGKTKVIIDEFGQAYNDKQIENLLVIAPAGSYRNWPDEFLKHFDRNLLRSLVIAIWRSGGSKKPIETLLNVRNRPRVLVVNFEAMSTVQLAQDTCRDFLKQGPTIMVIDESSRIKNINSKRTDIITEISVLAKRRRIMSGLPTPNSPLDLFAQFWFLDPRILGFNNYFAFRARYAILKKTFTGQLETRRDMYGRIIHQRKWVWTSQLDENGAPMFRNLDDLQRKIAPYCFRVTKENCLDLPPKIYERRQVELTSEQKRIYKELRSQALADLGGSQVTATRVITRMMRLQQCVCGHIVDDEKVLHELPNNRVKAILDILAEHNGKATIWCHFDHSVRAVSAALTELYGEQAVAKFWGGNAETRHLDERRWKTDPHCRFMVSTQAAGGIGNTWIEGSLVIYYANSYNLEHRYQSEDRAHRAGQRKSVTYIDLICQGTVDEIIIKALRQKINMAAMITGDNYQQWLI